MGEQHTKVPRNAESLGWLAQSAIPGKKQKVIEGVSAGSLVELKAQLYRKQEEAKLSRDGIDTHDSSRRRGGLDIATTSGQRNKGVEERDRRDKLQLKPVGTDRTAECYAALERKAALYDKLARGDIDDEEEKYDVDFFRKGYLNDEAAPGPGSVPTHDVDSTWEALGRTGGMMSADMERERERREWEERETEDLRELEEREKERDRRIQAFDRLTEETRAAREATAVQRQREADAAAKKRERLKQEFLKRQLAALKAGKRTTGGKGGVADVAAKT